MLPMKFELPPETVLRATVGFTDVRLIVRSGADVSAHLEIDHNGTSVFRTERRLPKSAGMLQQAGVIGPMLSTALQKVREREATPDDMVLTIDVEVNDQGRIGKKTFNVPLNAMAMSNLFQLFATVQAARSAAT